MAVDGRLGGVGLLAAGGLAAVLGGLTLAALASTVAETYPLRPAGFAVAGAAIGLALLLPIGLSTVAVRTMRRRGYAPAPVKVAGVALVLANIAWIVGIQVGSPVPVRTLLAERGTWVIDAMLGRGPFGPAALPVLAREIETLQEAERLADAAPMWCDETAGGFAVGLADGLRKTSPLPLAESLGAILDRHGVKDPAAPLPEDLDGQALLQDVRDVAAAAGPAVDLQPFALADLTPGKVERKRIQYPGGWEARYEGGAWRWCTGPAEQAVVRGRAYAAAVRDEAARAPTPVGGAAAGPWDAEVRSALQQAAFGRAAWLAGASAIGAEWGAALTSPAAAAQAERIRTWCAGAAQDPARKAAIDAVASRWTLPAAGRPVDPAVQALLDAQGRRYLDDVLAACLPVAGDRQVREAAKGLSIPDTQRRRWAELEARHLASTAQLADNGAGGVKITVDGRTLAARQEDGAWRIDWRD